jgi:hypothetical protein
VGQAHQEKGDYERHKRPVVGTSDAVVSPFAVMVKVRDTALARPTMFGLATHVCLANDTDHGITFKIKICKST